MFSLWYFSLHSHWSPCFGLRGLCFALCFPKQKSSSSDRRFHWRMLQGIFPVKAARKWRHHFVWILIHCNLFAIRYIYICDVKCVCIKYIFDIFDICIYIIYAIIYIYMKYFKHIIQNNYFCWIFLKAAVLKLDRGI